MTTILLIAHLIVCFFMIFIVLIQSGKGAELGAAFGGSSQTLFGARGAATFFSKLTTSAAVIFMLTSLLLAITTNKQGSVIPKSTPAATQQEERMPQEKGAFEGVRPPESSESALPAVPAQQPE
jgi:preprotein translocase subunit SecG